MNGMNVMKPITNFYKNPYAREKGWDPKNCENFSQLDKLMEED